MTSGAGGGALALECAAYLDAPSLQTIPVHIVNHRKTSVFLRTQCAAPFHVIDSVGMQHPAQLAPVTTSCTQALEGQFAFGDCMLYLTSEIAPGETGAGNWSGLFYDSKVLPAGCGGVPGLQAPCVQAIVPKPGPMVFAVDLDADVPYSATQIHATAPFVFGTDTSIDIVVD